MRYLIMNLLIIIDKTNNETNYTFVSLFVLDWWFRIWEKRRLLGDYLDIGSNNFYEFISSDKHSDFILYDAFGWILVNNIPVYLHNTSGYSEFSIWYGG